MRTVIHEPRLKWYREEPEIAFGFSSRAAYAMALDKPHYPMPASLGVSITANYLQRSHWMAGTLAWDTIRPYNYALVPCAI